MSSAHPVKEPSMDEILASIRRIIESGDERPGLAALNARSRDRDRERTAADDAGMPGGEAEPKAVTRLVAETATRPQAVAGGAEPAAPAGAPIGVHAGPGPAVRPPAEDDAPGEGASRPAGGAPAVSGPGDESQPRLRRTPLPDTADMLPAFWLKPARRAPAVAVPDIPSVSPFADRIFPAGGTAAVPFEEDPSGEEDDGPNAAALAPGRLPVIHADGAEAVSGEDGPPDFALDFDEEDFAEELRNEAHLAELKAGAGGESPETGAAAPAPASTEAAPDVAAPVPGSKPAGTAALISDAAGEQVAAAFDDLARAIREGQMKSMEEMAREMLRPMLQEWLDDNLPRLVERLVRDEIERVARGGRR